MQPHGPKPGLALTLGLAAALAFPGEATAQDSGPAGGRGTPVGASLDDIDLSKADVTREAEQLATDLNFRFTTYEYQPVHGEAVIYFFDRYIEKVDQVLARDPGFVDPLPGTYSRLFGSELVDDYDRWVNSGVPASLPRTTSGHAAAATPAPAPPDPVEVSRLESELNATIDPALLKLEGILSTTPSPQGLKAIREALVPCAEKLAELEHMLPGADVEDALPDRFKKTSGKDLAGTLFDYRRSAGDLAGFLGPRPIEPPQPVLRPVPGQVTYGKYANQPPVRSGKPIHSGDWREALWPNRKPITPGSLAGGVVTPVTQVGTLRLDPAPWIFGDAEVARQALFE